MFCFLFLSMNVNNLFFVSTGRCDYSDESCSRFHDYNPPILISRPDQHMSPVSPPGGALSKPIPNPFDELREFLLAFHIKEKTLAILESEEFDKVSCSMLEDQQMRELGLKLGPRIKLGHAIKNMV